MRKLFLFLALFIPSVLFAQGGPVVSSGIIVLSSSGRPIGGATVTICTLGDPAIPCTSTIPVFSDAALTQPASNPAIADGNGNIVRYAAAGNYTYTVTGNGIRGASYTASVIFGGTGCIPAGTNTLQKGNGAGGCTASGIIDDGTNVSFSRNFLGLSGPNPYIDVASSLSNPVRAVNPNATPAVAGITATCNGTAVVTLSGSPAITLQNGDGVSIPGCGTASGLGAPGAPTVVYSIARGMMGTNDSIPATAGATTYNYRIFAINKNLGVSAASSVGSTTTGGTLGSTFGAAINITSCTRVNQTVTCLTSAHTLPVGCVYSACPTIAITDGNALSDLTFEGIYQLHSIPDTTHFTYVGGVDTRMGGSASSTGGQFLQYTNNHLTWTASTGSPYIYAICSDRATPGTFHIIGHSWPVNQFDPGFSEGTLLFDDYGSPIMDSVPLMPGEVDTDCTGSGRANALVTTITNVAGTTLTLNTAATQSISGMDFRFDDTPNLITAATAAGTGYPLVFPYVSGSNFYVFNSFLDMTTVNTQMVGGFIRLNAPLLLNVVKWYGQVYPNGFSADSFNYDSLPTVVCLTPVCVHVENSAGTGIISYLRFVGGTNNSKLIWIDGGGGSAGGVQLSHVGMNTGSSSADYMGMCLIGRGKVGISFHVQGDHWQCNNGTNNGDFSRVTTPGVLGYRIGNFQLNGYSGQRRAFTFIPDDAGLPLSLTAYHIQGANTPFLTIQGRRDAGGAAGVGGTITYGLIDTSKEPHITYLPGQQGLIIRLAIGNLTGQVGPGFTGDPVTAMQYLAPVGVTPTGFGQNTGILTPVLKASLTTTAAASDNVSIPGMLAGGHCSLTATNANAAADSTGTFVSAKTTDQITVSHPANAGRTWDVKCTQD